MIQFKESILPVGWACAFNVLLLLASCGGGEQGAAERVPDALRGAENMAYKWGAVVLEGTANDTERNKPRPPVSSRMVALPMIAMFDAWSRYDSVAVPVYLSRVERRPASEQNPEHKAEAISYAACRVLQEVYPADSALFAQRLKEFGFDPNDRGLDPATPAGVGNLAARAVLDSRHHDGSNMYGDEPGRDTHYGDYTNYRPVNSPETLVDIDRWQPKYFISEKDGRRFAPGCLAPHWGHVQPFALDSASQFRCPPPPKMGDPLLEKEVRQVVQLQAELTNEQKALVEFMRDGPRSVQQAGHWLIFSRDISLRDNHTLDEDVQMYFVVSTTAMDCFIACWDAKMFYDNSRPYQQVHALMGEEDIVGWGGPHIGMVKMKGKDWRPYSPDSFLCPPFPAYPSGHSTVSGGCAKALELFTGSDKYDVQVRLLPGWLTEPGITTDSVTLSFPTFSSTAEQAGWSRVLGGYHIQTDNLAGLQLGRSVAAVTYAKCKAHIDGSAGK
ncbi:MAG: vanadium-dependent haloperoxidase [Flavobacteriales bacterium]|nr:vanadium-dependent haloperoxidase [Flavobacteriales bacterium]